MPLAEEQSMITVLVLLQLNECELILAWTALRAQPVVGQAEEGHTWWDRSSRISFFRIIDVAAHETLEAVSLRIHSVI